METHRDMLRAMALRLTRNGAEADDLVQETFARALERKDTLRNPQRMRSWLIRIMYNLFYDNRRTTQRRPVAAIAAEDIAISDSTRPSWVVLTETDVRQAVSDLDSNFRAVTQAHALEGRSYEQIAGELHVPKATIGTRLLRARTKLRAKLAPVVKTRRRPRVAPRRLDRMR